MQSDDLNESRGTTGPTSRSRAIRTVLEVRSGRRSPPAVAGFFVSAIRLLLGVANFGSPTALDSVYASIRGKPFAARGNAAQRG
jgi:hypothetical protein